MARTNTLGNFLTDVADAIREKSGTSELIQASNFDTAIENIPSGGADISEYIQLAPTTIESSTNNWWTEAFAKSDMSKVEIVAYNSRMTYMFSGCKWTYIPKISTNGTMNNLFLNYMFQNCSNVVSLDLSGMVGTVGRMSYMFSGCSSLTFLDIRGLTMSATSMYTACFNYVPTNCEIIVKDTTEKEWLLSKFTSLTNVKTASEYEAE